MKNVKQLLSAKGNAMGGVMLDEYNFRPGRVPAG